MADQLRLTGLRARGNHGVFDYERAQGQMFIVDLVVDLDTAAAADADDLEATVHYGVLAEEVVGVVTGEAVDLIETLAERIATVVLAHAAAQRVLVTVHKPEAPIAVPFGDVSITIDRASGR